MAANVVSRWLVVMILVGGLARPIQADLALLYVGGGPIADTDSLGMADVTIPTDPLVFDIVHLGPTLAAGSPIDFTVTVFDASEIMITPTSEFVPPGFYVPGTAIFPPPGLLSGAFFSLTGTPAGIPNGLGGFAAITAGPIPSGTVLASFAITPISPGISPDDELIDLDLFSATNPVIDPVLGLLAPATAPGASYDFQAIPEPSSFIFFGLIALSMFGRDSFSKLLRRDH